MHVGILPYLNSRNGHETLCLNAIIMAVQPCMPAYQSSKNSINTPLQDHQMHPTHTKMAFILKPAAVFCLVVVLLLHSPSCKADNVLYPGETLYSENYLEYGSYTFRMQSDCNLVLYDNGNPVWASNTGGLARDCHCTMQRDGNLVVYTPAGNPIWASNTGRAEGYYVLILQRDRNVVIYGTAIWATGTNAYNLNTGIPAVTVIETVGVAKVVKTVGVANANLTAATA